MADVYVYLVILLVFFLLPLLPLGWLVRAELPRYRRTIAWCLIFVYTLGWLWDWLSYRTGVWRYDSAPTLGIWIDGLPIEEFVGFYVLGTLLFVCVVLACRRRCRHV